MTEEKVCVDKLVSHDLKLFERNGIVVVSIARWKIAGISSFLGFEECLEFLREKMKKNEESFLVKFMT